MKKAGLCIFCFLSFAVFAQQVEWAKQYPSLGNTTSPKYITASPGSELAVAGNFYTYAVSQGVFLYRLDSVGNILWGDTARAINPYWNNSVCDAGGLAFKQNGKLVTGINFTDTLDIADTILPSHFAENKFILLQYDLQGNREWIKMYRNASLNDLYVDAADNMYALVSFKDTLTFYGATFYSAAKSDLLIAKINPGGNLVFSRQLHGNITGIKIKQAPSGEIVTLGRYFDTLYFDSYHFQGNNYFGDSFVLRTDTSGANTVYIPLPVSSALVGKDLEINYDGRTIATAEYSWTDGSQAYFNVYDLAGNLSAQTLGQGASYGCVYDFNNMAIADTAGVWCFGVEWNSGDYGNSTDDWTNYTITKFDLQGNIIMRDTFPLSGGAYMPGKDLCSDARHNLFLTSSLNGANNTLQIGNYTLLQNDINNQTFFVAKISQDSQVTSNVNQSAEKESVIEIFPNPSSGTFTVSCDQPVSGKICVRDISGHCIFSQAVSGQKKIIIGLGEPPKGIYFVEIELGGKRITKKIIMD